MKKEIVELAKKYGMSSEEYEIILEKIENNDDDLSIENINIDEEIKNTSGNVRLLTGVTEIDELTKGLTAGVHIISGFRKCCKSTLAINLIYRALNEGLNVCLLSLEMSKIDVLNTLVSLHSFEVNAETAITRDELAMLYQIDREQYNNRLYSFMSLPGQLIIHTEDDLEMNKRKNKYRYCYSEINLNSIFEESNKSCYKNTGNPVQLLVVDNINCIRSWEGKNGGEFTYSSASNFFRKTALNFGNNLKIEDSNEDNLEQDSYAANPVICLLLCQINRSGGERATYEGFYPESCIAETVNLERDATTIIPIYTNQSYIESNIALIKLEASRYSKAMLNAVEIPAELEYGKLGEPIGKINYDIAKEKILREKNKYKLVNVKTPTGDKTKILVPKDEELPFGYEEIIENVGEKIYFLGEDDSDEEDF